MRTFKLNEPQPPKVFEDAPAYKCISSDLRIDVATRAIYVRKHACRSDENPWLDLGIQHAWAPPCPISPHPTRLIQHDRTFWTIVMALDSYVLKQKGSKSHHIIVSDICRTLIKTFEFTWAQGFYDPRDVPEAAWDQLRSDLVAGSWPAALRVEERTALLLAKQTSSPMEYVSGKHDRRIDRYSLRGSFTDLLGTNIASRELRGIKEMLLQATEDDALRSHGDVKRYRRVPPQRMSRTMLTQTLRAINLLAEIPQDFCVRTLPADSSYEYAMRHGRIGNRTENIDPDTWAKLLTHAYRWIYELGPSVVELIRALALHLEPFYDEDMRRRTREAPSVKSYRSALIRKVLFKVEEVRQVEGLLKLKITNFVRKHNPHGETSIYAILGQLFSSCFVVLASMNGRRRDEVLGRSIGLHLDSMWRLEGELDLYECEFYIEKTVKDYVPHLVNDVSQRAIQIMKEIAEVAWLWSETVDPDRQKSIGRERKLFIYPDFAGAKKGVPLWFDFNANEAKCSESFVADALGSDRSKFKVAAHMFRRAYGLLYHYRYENGLLIALTQKYGHIDTASTLHYLTDSSHTPLGRTAAAKWSAPRDSIQRAQQEQTDDLKAAIREVGEEKLRSYVSDVVQGSRQFSGGFSRLVARYHRMLSGHISYRQLDDAQQHELLGDALIARGHAPYPYPGNTCMAGRSRKHAACSVGKGELARERASPAVCLGCPYSDTNAEQLAALERDAESLARRLVAQPKTVGEFADAGNLANLRRIITLHKQRLEERS